MLLDVIARCSHSTRRDVLADLSAGDLAEGEGFLFSDQNQRSSPG